MKIGILINDLGYLLDWELQVINKVIAHDKLELELLILDGRRIHKNKSKQRKGSAQTINSKLTPGKILFKLQALIEKKLFRNYIVSDRVKNIDHLTSLNTIYVQPQRRGTTDILTREDAYNIRKYKLDLILKLGFDIIEGQVNDISKHGIWALNHSENSIYPIEVAGFREITSGEPAVCVTLEQLTENAETGLVIDKAYFNRHWSFVITNTRILEASTSILFKNINKLLTDDYTSNKATNHHDLDYKYPDLWNVVKYLPGFYIGLIKELITANFKLFGIRYECWTLFIGEGDFSHSTLTKAKPVTLRKKEFWADPFIFNYENINYVFFENYSYSSKKGKICCGKIDNNDLVDITDVLNLDYHLSFPNIFEENKEIYLMPETAGNKRLEIYRCITFPNIWELYSTAFEGEEIYDPVLYTDDKGLRWLLFNKKAGINSKENNELHIYQVDSIKLNELIPHSQNPVIIDSRIARNGGAVFKKNGKTYRPSQANIDGIYGRALNINTIDKLTIDDYHETRISTYYPHFHEGLISMHHLHQLNNLFVIDAAYKRK